MKELGSFLPDFAERKGIRLGLARNGDAERIGDLSKDLIEVGLARRVWNAREVVRQIGNPGSLVLVAREERELVAFAIAEFGKKATDLMLLGVASKFQRLGIGTRLVRALEGNAFALGHASIHLLVRSTNLSAQTFYRKLGFRQVDVICDYYTNHESALQMRHRLTFQPAYYPASR